jgi:hypothetical protein
MLQTLCVQIKVEDVELFELEGMVKQLMAAAGSEVEAAEAAAAAVAEAAAEDAGIISAKTEHAVHAIQITAVAGGGAGS